MGSLEQNLLPLCVLPPTRANPGSSLMFSLTFAQLVIYGISGVLGSTGKHAKLDLESWTLFLIEFASGSKVASAGSERVFRSGLRRVSLPDRFLSLGG